MPRRHRRWVEWAATTRRGHASAERPCLERGRAVSLAPHTGRPGWYARTRGAAHSTLGERRMTAAQAGGGRVMIVEDDPVLGDLVHALLADEGYTAWVV